MSSEPTNPFAPPTSSGPSAIDEDDPEYLAAQMMFAEVRKVLLFVVALYGLQALISLMAGVIPSAVLTGVFALVYLGLWAAAGRAPFFAMVTASVLFILPALASSGSLMGLTINALIVVGLFRGMRLALRLRRVQARLSG